MRGVVAVGDVVEDVPASGRRAAEDGMRWVSTVSALDESMGGGGADVWGVLWVDVGPDHLCGRAGHQ